MSKQKSNSVELATHTINSIREVFAIQEPTVPFLNTLGHAHMKLGQFNEAAQAYEQSLKLDPSDHIADYYLKEAKQKLQSEFRVLEMI